MKHNYEPCAFAFQQPAPGMPPSTAKRKGSWHMYNATSESANAVLKLSYTGFWSPVPHTFPSCTGGDGICIYLIYLIISSLLCLMSSFLFPVLFHLTLPGLSLHHIFRTIMFDIISIARVPYHIVDPSQLGCEWLRTRDGS